MKKRKIILMPLLIGIFLCACTVGGRNVLIDNDREVANSNFEEFLTYLQTKDKEKLLYLFSEEVLNSSTALDISVEEMFDYFFGKVESYNDWGGPVVETIKEDGQVIQTMESSYDVKTTEGGFRFAIRYITKDTANPNHEGIQSVYVIKLEDDPTPGYAYWGDGKYTPGINIGIVGEE